jgi:putative YphP/YqiW family bacilliredoxin
LRYPEQLIAAMRQDLTRHGVQETRTPEEVDHLLAGSGSVLMVINSVCGCAAGKARPGIALALRHDVRPDRVATVFAGADLEAVARVRELATEYPPSSPSAILFRDGKPVYMLPRNQIENRGPQEIAAALTQAFETHCAVSKQ